MARNQTVIVAALVAAALLWSRRANAAPVDWTNPVPDDGWNSDDYSDPTDYGGTGDPYNPGVDFVTVNETADSDSRVRAFLWMIGAAETSPPAMASGAAFRTFYGGSLFSDMSDHPVITGEKSGVRLPDEWCRAAGFSPGCVTTAAGALQFTKSTWNLVREGRPMWGPRLPDFSEASQMEAGRRLLMLDGALPYVQRGEFDAALRKASRRWASLPGSTAGQGGRSMAWLSNIYGEALGVA